MTEQKKTRRELLEKFVSVNPGDAFALYGLAIECMNQGDAAAADLHFRDLLERNSEYVPGYLIYAQFLVRQERPAEAKRVVGDGIAAAARKGDSHASSELEALLLEIP